MTTIRKSANDDYHLCRDVTNSVYTRKPNIRQITLFVNRILRSQTRLEMLKSLSCIGLGINWVLTVFILPVLNWTSILSCLPYNVHIQCFTKSESKSWICLMFGIFSVFNHIFALFIFAGKVEPHTSSFNMGYLVSPYTYANGAGGPIPVSMVSRSYIKRDHHKDKLLKNDDFLI